MVDRLKHYGKLRSMENSIKQRGFSPNSKVPDEFVPEIEVQFALNAKLRGMGFTTVLEYPIKTGNIRKTGREEVIRADIAILDRERFPMHLIEVKNRRKDKQGEVTNKRLGGRQEGKYKSCKIPFTACYHMDEVDEVAQRVAREVPISGVGGLS